MEFKLSYPINSIFLSASKIIPSEEKVKRIILRKPSKNLKGDLNAQE